MISSVCICCSGLIKSALVFLVVDPSILCREGGVGFFLTWRKKSLRSFSERKGGGWAPFMPNITILIALMLFLEEGGKGERERAAQSQQLHSLGCLIAVSTTILLLILTEYMTSSLLRCSDAAATRHNLLLHRYRLLLL